MWNGNLKITMNRTQIILTIVIVFGVIAIIFLAYDLINKNRNNESSDVKNYNIIVYDIIPLRHDHLGVYGYYRNTTPNTDAFASDSFVFENAISQSSWTLPAHTSLMTSLYPSVHKVTTDNSTLSDDIITLQQILKKNGYKTAMFSDGIHIAPKFGFDRGFDDVYYKCCNDPWQEGKALRDWIYTNANEKFYISFASFSLHDPYVLRRSTPSPGYEMIFDTNYSGKVISDDVTLVNEVNKIKENLTMTELQNLTIGNLTLILNITEDPDLLTKLVFWKSVNVSNQDDRNHVIALYDENIRLADSLFGDLINTLNDLKLLEKTIIVLHSDHGEAFGEHDIYLHQGTVVYEEQTHVPLIIKIPKLKGVIITQQAQIIDLLPTILDILNINETQTIEGKSLLPIMKGSGDADFNKYVFTETDVVRAVRTNGWKLIENRISGKYELYDLNTDPSEKINLYYNQTQVATELKQKLIDFSFRSTSGVNIE